MITITVSGPRAAGKTTLARHLHEYLTRLGHNVELLGSVDEGHGLLDPLPSRKIEIREKHSIA